MGCQVEKEASADRVLRAESELLRMANLGYLNGKLIARQIFIWRLLIILSRYWLKFQGLLSCYGPARICLSAEVKVSRGAF